MISGITGGKGRGGKGGGASVPLAFASSGGGGGGRFATGSGGGKAGFGGGVGRGGANFEGVFLGVWRFETGELLLFTERFDFFACCACLRKNWLILICCCTVFELFEFLVDVLEYPELPFERDCLDEEFIELLVLLLT